MSAMLDQFTKPALRFWKSWDDRAKTLVLNNVWCVSCRKGTTIVRFTGRIERADLILEGECIRCGGSVARVVESH